MLYLLELIMAFVRLYNEDFVNWENEKNTDIVTDIVVCFLWC